MAEHVTVTVSQGALRGRKKTTKSGGPLLSFQGIPYAMPPVGELRFKAPEQPESWSGIRDALKEGSPCPHYHMLTNEFVGDEDCLFVNVYTPKVPTGRSEPLLAVMVWIHGGAFVMGSGDSDMYGPDYLVDAGVVLVTLNYRLGPLGFLSLENDEIPGNCGLKDQVAALRWVKQNIANFGGDPENVTIFGESAGAASVHYQLLSPMSKGLFKRAICQSGTSLNPWALSKSARARAFQLGEAMGCKTKDDKELLAFLKKAEPLQLFENLEKAMNKEEERLGIKLLFVPNVEKVVKGQEAFLTADPSKLLEEGKFHTVPFMAGVNSHEGIVMIKDVVQKPQLLGEINNDFERLVPRKLISEKGSARTKEFATKIKKFYFGEEALSQETLLEYVHLNSDLYFTWGMHNTVKKQLAHSSAPIFYYMFSFNGELNLLKKQMGASRLPGACHADELSYLFTSSFVDIKLDPTSPEMKTISRLVKLWTNFAKTGNPTPELSGDVTVRWTPYTSANPVYLHISSDLALEKNLEKARMEFWEELYKL